MATTTLLAGAYGYGPDPQNYPGGLHLLSFDATAGALSSRTSHAPGQEAGYLALAPDGRTVYTVDERKNDGRGPVGPAASIQAFRLDASGLSFLGGQPALGPFPTYLSTDPAGRWLAVAAHGSFDHVERVVATAGGWTVEQVYDDSTVSLYPLGPDGAIGPLADLVVLAGHGPDPGASPQAGGHAQASAHAHCAQFDPSGRFVVVCDKGTDTIHVYDVSSGRLDEAARHAAAPGTAPRHAAFHPAGDRLVVTNELASTVTSYRFDPASGALAELATVSTLAPGGSRYNEPADIQLSPDSRFVVVNNRGQDTVVVLRFDAATGALAYAAHAQLAGSIHAGLAARSFRFDPAGAHLFVADRPAEAIIAYAVDPATGALTERARAAVPQPAFVLPL